MASYGVSGHIFWFSQQAGLAGDRPAWLVFVRSIGAILIIGTENIGSGQIAVQANKGQLQIDGSGELHGGSFSVSASTDIAAAAQWFEFSAVDRSPSISPGVDGYGLTRLVRARYLGSGDMKASDMKDERFTRATLCGWLALAESM